MKLVKLKIKQVADTFILEPIYRRKKTQFSLFGINIKLPSFLLEVNDLEKAVDRVLYTAFAQRFRRKILDKYEHSELIHRIDVRYNMKELWILELTPRTRKQPDYVIQQVITDLAEEIIQEWNKNLDNVNLEIRNISEVEVSDD